VFYEQINDDDDDDDYACQFVALLSCSELGSSDEYGKSHAD